MGSSLVSASRVQTGYSTQFPQGQARYTIWSVNLWILFSIRLPKGKFSLVAQFLCAPCRFATIGHCGKQSPSTPIHAGHGVFWRMQWDEFIESAIRYWAMTLRLHIYIIRAMVRWSITLGTRFPRGSRVLAQSQKVLILGIYRYLSTATVGFWNWNVF